MIREIGSEFEEEFEDYYLAEDGTFFESLPSVDDYCLTLSGRTAIETVIKQIGTGRKVYFPSYCCASMLKPFRDNGICVEFYSVSFSNKVCIEIESIADNSVLFYCHYFGFDGSFLSDDLVDRIHRSGGLIIEDITHSLLSKSVGNMKSDYYVASLRKWFPVISGGICMRRKGMIQERPSQFPNQLFVEKKRNAMQMKARYLRGENIEKATFLSMFAETNEWLADHYSNMRIDDFSYEYLKHVDIEKVREVRKANAMRLFQGMVENDNVKFLYHVNEMNCPLFVPIAVYKNREMTRKQLVSNGVFCPVHWPKPDDECNSNIYELELSLVCDQRYNETDMDRVLDICNEVLRG